jgi:3,4-dihydroxyphenylacetate 2,3-dioxygenase
MGEIVGAAVVSHVPPIVMGDEVRAELYGAEGTTLVDGLHRLRREKFDRIEIDTVIVFDSHWFTTVEHILTAHDRREGMFTSSELPRGMSGHHYDMPGDPELAIRYEAISNVRDDTRALACADPYLPVHYATTNLLPFLQRGDEAWLSMSICQTGTPPDWLLAGELLGQAIRELDRRVVLLASGGLSHRFWPMREFADHEAAGLEHIRTPEARAADEAVIAALEAGDHAKVIDGMPAYKAFGPEGAFGHYLMMAGALGGAECTAPGVKYSNYESSAGTGQIHLWFEPPWVGGRD